MLWVGDLEGGGVQVAIYENPGFPNPGFRSLWICAPFALICVFLRLTSRLSFPATGPLDPGTDFKLF